MLILDRPPNPRQLLAQLPQIGVSLWRMENGVQLPVTPDEQGFLMLESIGVRLRADGRKLVAHVAASGEPLLTSPELVAALEAAEQARQQAEQRVAVEAAARQQAEDELAQLREELARLRGKLDDQ